MDQAHNAPQSSCQGWTFSFGTQMASQLYSQQMLRWKKNHPIITSKFVQIIHNCNQITNYLHANAILQYQCTQQMENQFTRRWKFGSIDNYGGGGNNNNNNNYNNRSTNTIAYQNNERKSLQIALPIEHLPTFLYSLIVQVKIPLSTSLTPVQFLQMRKNYLILERYFMAIQAYMKKKFDRTQQDKLAMEFAGIYQCKQQYNPFITEKFVLLNDDVFRTVWRIRATEKLMRFIRSLWKMVQEYSIKTKLYQRALKLEWRNAKDKEKQIISHRVFDTTRSISTKMTQFYDQNLLANKKYFDSKNINIDQNQSDEDMERESQMSSSPINQEQSSTTPPYIHFADNLNFPSFSPLQQQTNSYKKFMNTINNSYKVLLTLTLKDRINTKDLQNKNNSKNKNGQKSIKNQNTIIVSNGNGIISNRIGIVSDRTGIVSNGTGIVSDRTGIVSNMIKNQNNNNLTNANTNTNTDKSEHIIIQGYTFQIKCISPHVCFQRISDGNPHSILLTSGTLAPMGAWAPQLNIQFPIRYVGKPVNQGRLLARIICKDYYNSNGGESISSNNNNSIGSSNNIGSNNSIGSNNNSIGSNNNSIGSNNNSIGSNKSNYSYTSNNSNYNNSSKSKLSLNMYPPSIETNTSRQVASFGGNTSNNGGISFLSAISLYNEGNGKNNNNNDRGILTNNIIEKPTNNNNNNTINKSNVNSIQYDFRYAFRNVAANKKALMDSVMSLLEKLLQNSKGTVLVVFSSKQFLKQHQFEWNKKVGERLTNINALKEFQSKYISSKNYRTRDSWAKMRCISEKDCQSAQIGIQSIKGSINYFGKALFFCVNKGSISQGINLSDELCRVVVIIGQPFLPKQDYLVSWKIARFDDLKNAVSYDQQALESYHLETYEPQTHSFQSQDVPLKVSDLMTSSSYSLTMMLRSVNQSIGRLMRHKNDYGAVYLIDHRWNYKDSKEGLAGWVKCVVSCAQSYNHQEELTTQKFFQRMVRICQQQRQREIQQRINEQQERMREQQERIIIENIKREQSKALTLKQQQQQEYRLSQNLFNSVKRQDSQSRK